MSNQITLTIDGMQVSVNSGITIYWAAKKLGIKIPHLCYGEDLPPMSTCRLCVVRCQDDVDLAEIFHAVREVAAREGFIPSVFQNTIY